MLMPDELSLMTEEEKLELVRKLSEAEEWQESFEQVYTHLMDDDSARVREEAIGALWYVADLQHMEPLMRRAENDPSDEVRGRAVSVLGIYVYEGVVNMSEEEPRYQAVWRFLLDLANDPDESLFVRRMAIEALSFADDDEVNDLIEWAYEHASMEVRMSAIFAMGRSQQVRWHETILAEMDSEEFQLRQEAINAAGEARLAEATPRLRVLASHPNQEVRVLRGLLLERGSARMPDEEYLSCPRCTDVLIRMHGTSQPAKYYGCLTCYGRWLDGNEVARLAKRSLAIKMERLFERLLK